MHTVINNFINIISTFLEVQLHIAYGHFLLQIMYSVITLYILIAQKINKAT